MIASEAINAARLFVIWLEGHKIHKSAQTVRALIEENEQLHAEVNELRAESAATSALVQRTLREAVRSTALAEREQSAIACDEIAARTPVGGDIAAECAQAVRMRGVAGVRSGLFDCGLTPAKEVR